jgi:hypothetical protein
MDRSDWWLFVKYMFWPVVMFLLIVGNLTAYLVTNDSKYLVIGMLWLIVSKIDGLESRNG